MLDDFGERGPVIAVFDGRFLPIEEFSVEMKNDHSQVQTIGGDSFSVRTGESSIDVGFRTLREPNPRNKTDNTLFLFDRNYKVSIKDATVTRDGQDLDGFEGGYTVELRGISFEIAQR